MSLLALLSGKVVVGVAASSVTLGGAVGAAYAGALPAPLQTAAHDVLGAPAAAGATTVAVAVAATETPDPTATPSESPSPSESAEPSESPSPTESAVPSQSPAPTATPSATRGPDATGPAAYGLCNAYLHGGLGHGSTAYASLSVAAGGAANINTYCAGVAHPGASQKHEPSGEDAKPAGSGHGLGGGGGH